MTTKKTAKGQGSTVPIKFAIQSGGARLTESITQPTKIGGIKSRILFKILDKHDHEKNCQCGRR